MTPTTKPRERLLAAATRLFLREGINAVGVDRLSEAAQVSKRSLYQHFGTKDAVVAAMLDEVAPQVLGGYLSAADDDRSPRDRMLAVFEAQAELAASPSYVGCPFVNVATELHNRDHPASQRAQAAKLLMTAYFRRQAEQLPVADPDTLATQLTMIFDGASAHAVMHGTGIPDAARRAAATLIDATANERAAG